MITARTKRFAEFIAKHGEKGLQFLSPRDEKVVKLLAEGKDYHEIGLSFAVSGSRITNLARKADAKIKELEQTWDHQARIAPIEKPLKEFFLEAAAKTYASGGSQVPKTTIADLPGSKVYHYERGNMLYIDTYFTNGERSGGQKVIYQKDEDKWKPVWLMQYHGWCKDDNPRVLAFLKRALSDAYKRGIFFGGRGIDDFEEGNSGFRYSNNPMGSFESGSGGESIYQGSERVFWHTYQHFMLASTG